MKIISMESMPIPQNNMKSQKMENNGETARENELRKASEQLEGLFLTTLFKAMEKTIPEGMFSDSKNNMASMLFSSMMGDTMAKKGGIGLAEAFYKSLSKEDVDSLKELQSKNHMETIYQIKSLESGND